KNVRSRPRDPPLFQRPIERLLVPDRPPGEIENEGRGFHHAELPLADKSLRLGDHRKIDGDEIRPGEDLFRARLGGPDLLFRLLVTDHVVIEDLHVKPSVTDLSDRPSDPAEAEDAEGL